MKDKKTEFLKDLLDEIEEPASWSEALNTPLTQEEETLSKDWHRNFCEKVGLTPVYDEQQNTEQYSCDNIVYLNYALNVPATDKVDESSNTESHNCKLATVQTSDIDNPPVVLESVEMVPGRGIISANIYFSLKTLPSENLRVQIRLNGKCPGKEPNQFILNYDNSNGRLQIQMRAKAEPEQIVFEMSWNRAAERLVVDLVLKEGPL